MLKVCTKVALHVAASKFVSQRRQSLFQRDRYTTPSERCLLYALDAIYISRSRHLAITASYDRLPN